MPKIKSRTIPIEFLRLTINPYSELELPENPMTKKRRINSEKN